MSNIIINSTSALTGITNATIDGINYSNIKRGSIDASARAGVKDNIWINSYNSWKPAVNAVDIDWNNAYLPSISYINTTSDLLNIIANMQTMIDSIEAKLQ